MCGIVAFIGHGAAGARLADVRGALRCVSHRGPDDAGTIVLDGAARTLRATDAAGRETALPCPPTGPAGLCIFGHHRLAIIDPSPLGHQPMTTPDGRYTVVLNGEIYNHVELRRELEARGRRFRSRSDTEALLYAFVEWGPSCLERLVGMYAFLALDAAAGRVFAARDPFGMKPLYYRALPDGLAFASEIPALLALDPSPPRADAAGVHDYLARGVTDHRTGTLFAGIEALPPAHAATIALDAPAVLPARYWAMPGAGTSDLSFDAAAARLRELLLESVTLHLRADVRVGTLLSGGVDSSGIVAAMRQVGGPALELHTFSFLAGPDAIDETPWIDRVNAAVSAVPHPLRLTPDEFAADLPALVRTQGEPFGTVAIYAQSRLFQLAAATGVRAVLDGQGGDELFGGYRGAWPAHLAGLLRRGRIAAAGRLLRGVARQRGWWDPSPRAVALRGAVLALPSAVFDVIRSLRGPAPSSLVDPAWAGRQGLDGRDAPPPRTLAGVLRHGVADGLPGLLRVEDRASMAHAVEARLPLLTTRIAELALGVPAEYHIGADGTNKRLLRAALEGLVPPAVLARRDKVGFAVPSRTWLQATPGAAAALRAALDLPPVRRTVAAPLLAALETGRPLSDREYFLLWRLLGFAAWVRTFGVRCD